ncbi:MULTISPECIES: efflux RND transporter periplasmic adaptor subunit [unclassified Achromobacter]|uniref:efflux RND transporter periplasmic adaptor subunit n=1 Tax=unclassified Achromobacter TaxID=2626865 RepID=UPI001E451BA1|nr:MULTISPECIES: efflux RND transporter periplasmic adaptor subunit [unclassified Achromobacter]
MLLRLSVAGLGLGFGVAQAQNVAPPPLADTLSPTALPGGASMGHETASLQTPMACLIEPFMVSELGSPIAGVIDKISVQRGDTVKKGDVVATLNSKVDEATLNVRRGEAAYLARAVQRNSDMYQRKLLPASDYDEISSKSRQAALQVELQQAILGERSIRSPFDGVVAERYAGPGDRINDNKIVKLAQIDPLLVKVVVPEGLYGQVKMDAGADVTVNSAISDKPLRATVWRIDKVMDAASGTFVVLLKVDNKNNRIPAGIRCSVHF